MQELCGLLMRGKDGSTVCGISCQTWRRECDSLGMFAGSDKGGHFDESKVYLGLWSINGFCDFCFDTNCLFALCFDFRVQ